MSAAMSPHPTEAPNGATTLTASQMAMVLAGLRRVGAYGEVHLIVKEGRVRFIRTVQSISVPEEALSTEE